MTPFGATLVDVEKVMFFFEVAQGRSNKFEQTFAKVNVSGGGIFIPRHSRGVVGDTPPII